MPETREIEIKDVLAAVVPEHLDASTPESRAALLPDLYQLAVDRIVAQYGGNPPTLIIDDLDWLITDRPEDVEKFQPAHDCAACRAGNDQSLAYLREHPGRFIALGNLTYREVWS